jgi:glycerophosphoryl diester phosphodiesterase
VIEFDVLDLIGGPLVLAHSDHLEEVSHGAARGRVRTRSLEALREVAPELPTLDEALAFFVDEAPHVGVHVDLKLRSRLDELGAAIRRHGLESRTVVSGHHVSSLRSFAAAAPGATVGLTYPEDKISISRKPYLWPIVSLGLTSMRASVPYRVPRLARAAGAGAVMLQHRLVTPSAVERAHAVGLPVLAWTVDELTDLERVDEAGVDGVITNDPRIFVATLKP